MNKNETNKYLNPKDSDDIHNSEIEDIDFSIPLDFEEVIESYDKEKQTREVLNELMRWLTYTVKSEDPECFARINLRQALNKCLEYFNLNNSEIRVVPARDIGYLCFCDKETGKL